jgi:tRNA(Ile)-lysidine synthase TilS/MesJ
VVFRLVKSLDKAAATFGLIEPADRIVVGISGGKDSVGLLYLLWWQRRIHAHTHELLPVHVADSAVGDGPAHALEAWLARLDMPLLTVRANLRPPPDARRSPCFSCSWNRKKALFETAERLGSSVVALGHHSDDVAVTALMNLFLQGRFGGILPIQAYFQGRFRLIRPLYFVSERSLQRLARVERLPVSNTICEFSAASRRTLARSWLDSIVRDHPYAKRSLLGALHRQAMAGVVPGAAAVVDDSLDQESGLGL